jgi:nitrate/nitrite transport system substrate-binding protein
MPLHEAHSERNDDPPDSPFHDLAPPIRRRGRRAARRLAPAFQRASWAAGEGPEVTDLRFGIIALTDNSPIVIAHEKGLFKKYGINSTVVKGASWAAIRDSLSNGDIQATHMLHGMPIASTMGLLGSPKKPMVIPWMLNRNGQSITLATRQGQGAGRPQGAAAAGDGAQGKGHAADVRDDVPARDPRDVDALLAGGGRHQPDKDVTLIVIPPPQMVANMKVGKMDGFCVGEPWNARAIADGIGFTAINTQDIWKDHPEKVCAFTRRFADKNPKTVKAVLQGAARGERLARRHEEPPRAGDIVSRRPTSTVPRS